MPVPFYLDQPANINGDDRYCLRRTLVLHQRAAEQRLHQVCCQAALFAHFQAVAGFLDFFNPRERHDPDRHQTEHQSQSRNRLLFDPGVNPNSDVTHAPGARSYRVQPV